MKNSVVVFFGGRSFEHDVSIITGLQAISNLNKFKYNILPVYITKKGKWLTGEKLKDVSCFKNFDEKNLAEVFLKSGSNVLYSVKGKKNKPLAQIMAAVVATHGGEGEDGTLASVLQASCVAKTCPDVLGCALTMSKSATKKVLRDIDAPFLCEIKGALEFPVIVKPDVLGSSIGISVCKNNEDLTLALELCKEMGTKPVIEKALVNFCEFNIAAFKKENEIILSEIEKPNKQGDILSFENKYIGGTMQGISREFPAVINEELKNKIETLAKLIYKSFELSGVCRIDFLFDNETEKLYVNEINTIPGSLAFYLFKNKFSFSRLLDELINEAIKTENKRAKNLFFESKIIDKFCESKTAQKNSVK